MWVLGMFAACHREEPATDDEDLLLPASPVLALDSVSNSGLAANAEITHATVSEGSDFAIDWSALATDLFGAPVDATSIRGVSITAVSSSAEEVADGLGRGALESSANLGRWQAPASGSAARASDLVDPDGYAFDPATWVKSNQTLLVTVVNTDQRVLSAMTVAGGGTDNQVALDGSSIITYQVTPGSYVLSTNTGSGPWSIDWAEITATTTGAPFDPLGVDRVWIAQIPGASAVAADWVLDPEAAASEYYGASVEGVTVVDMTDMLGANATFFSSFAAGGTWFVGLDCVHCPLSAPVYRGELRVVTPSE